MHAPDGQLTPQQAAQLLELSHQGDTGVAVVASPETAGALAAAPTSEAQATTDVEQAKSQEQQQATESATTSTQKAS